MMPTSISRCLRAFVRGTLAGNVVFSRRHESTEVRWQLSGGEVGDDGFEELLAEGAGLGDSLFELVHQNHQFIDFRHNPFLFGWRWKRNSCLL